MQNGGQHPEGSPLPLVTTGQCRFRIAASMQMNQLSACQQTPISCLLGKNFHPGLDEAEQMNKKEARRKKKRRGNRWGGRGNVNVEMSRQLEVVAWAVHGIWLPLACFPPSYPRKLIPGFCYSSICILFLEVVRLKVWFSGSCVAVGQSF